MSWLEQRMAWSLGWGDGRNPGAVYFLLNRRVAGHTPQVLRMVRHTLTAGIGALLAGPWLTAGNMTIFLPPVLGLLAMGLKSFGLTRRLLASGLLRELAITPLGPAEVLRDIHITAVAPIAFAGIGWIAGHVFWLPLGAEGILTAALIVLLIPGLLWRASLIGSMIAIGLDGWRPSPAAQRRVVIVALLGILLLLLALIAPALILIGIGLQSGRNLYLVWVPLSLAPGLAFIGGLIWWLKRRRMNGDIGKLLSADAERMRALLGSGIDL